MNTNESNQLSISVNESDHKQGGPNAKITLLEYGDYQCPYCGMAYPIIKQLQKEFRNDLQFVFRNFPLTQIHEHAFNAAETAEISDEYGKFWEMHDMIYENQKNLDNQSLMHYITKLGIDKDVYVTKMQSHDKSEKIKSDFMSGVESGVAGTPGFFINGYQYNGSWDYHTLKNVLNTLL